MNFDTLARKITENATAHGWWETKRDPREVLALIHSELSEALEEYRSGRPMIWTACDAPIEVGSACACMERNGFCTKETCTQSDVGYKHPKPEGIAVELIDAVIRILDLMGHYGFKFVYDQPAEEDPTAPLPVFVACLHYDVSSLMQTAINECGEIVDVDEVEGTLSQIIGDIQCWLNAHGVDFASVLETKMEYNINRPYKHGGKIC